MGIILYDLVLDKYYTFPESMTKPNNKNMEQKLNPNPKKFDFCDHN